MKSYAGIITDRHIKSLPTRGAWIEIVLAVKDGFYGESLPTRGAWIEIEP